MPAPAARIRSASVPCGQSSIVMSPERYCFSKALLFPKKLMMSLLTCPDFVINARPPTSSMPALFDTAVKEFSDCGPRFLIACIKVSATPDNPNPALRMVDPDWRSATASSADLKSFDRERSMTGSRGTGWLRYLFCDTMRHLLSRFRAARNCAGSGLPLHIRDGSVRSNREAAGIASMMQN